MEQGNISELPEGCISHILSLTSPRDAFTSSLMSTTFKSAADSDAVWEKFLPSDYRDIVARAVPALDLSGFGSKKQLFFRLCQEPVLIDGGNKSLSLEKKSGKKCFMIGARELVIHWGDTSRYWSWIPDDESRFAEVAQLIFVCWLYISGTIDTRTLTPKTTYAVYLVIKFANGAHGFEYPIAEVAVDFASGGGSASGSRTAYMDPEYKTERRRRNRYNRSLNPTFSPDSINYYPREREDGWMELELGEFYNDDGEDGVVSMTLGETKELNSKGGLIVQGIEVRPKGN